VQSPEIVPPRNTPSLWSIESRIRPEESMESEAYRQEEDSVVFEMCCGEDGREYGEEYSSGNTRHEKEKTR